MDPKELRALFEKKATEGHGEFAIAYALLRLADTQAAHKQLADEIKAVAAALEKTAKQP
ncbi:MAG: hypothetical protein JO056_08155 [Alphaproteobacteria bacterium]|nr:hypothetical protein [Alphaproteobacteria bacterium]